jgi:Xaa-Pro aminopeptidase
MTATALAPMEVATRLEHLRVALTEADGLLLTSLTNIRYLTGFTGSAGVLFVLPDSTVLLTDGRYATQADEQLSAAGVDAGVEIAPASGQAARAGAVLAAGGGVGRLGLEAAHISWARQQSFAKEWFPGVELVPTVGLVEGLRRVKDAGELDRLAEAARIADAALDTVRPLLAERPTEVEFGRSLDFEMRRLGASGPSFETIVAGGPNAAKPHHRPSSRRIEAGEPIVIDFGALFEGYCSDMTRTVWVDAVADADLRRAVEVVLASQAAGVAAVGPGVACTDVDRACREVIGDAGWADRFVHGTGHGVGLDIHEAPSVGATSTDTLAVGHVVTVEPGVYLPGLGGVRIEDTVVVTEDGCRPLTHTPKDFV